ncbi:retinol dehydrogenase 10-B-like isoform X2 [Branchiostoma lanceolatum]|uniref:retinol dehydrogenase 10-B-like isoform X2 n=1 Tax=Branchiostoma lanceolatum TaxID=7740 RepID=UPI003454A937
MLAPACETEIVACRVGLCGHDVSAESSVLSAHLTPRFPPAAALIRHGVCPARLADLEGNLRFCFCACSRFLTCTEEVCGGRHLCDHRIAEQVKTEVGDVSILVNNAGVVCGKTLLELPDEGIEKTFAVNTLAHFWTVKAFLPGMLANNHGHIISIASIAGHYGGVGLCDYSASKFGAVGFEECLRYEIRRTEKLGIYTTAAYPWIISTGMFEGFSPKEGWLLPPLEPQHAVNSIMHGILTNREVVFVPGILNFFTFLKPVLPMDAMWAVVKFFGIDTAMDTFKGRKKQE